MNKELTADEMLKNLGYESIDIDRRYEDEDGNVIYFYDETRTIAKDNCYEVDTFEITMNELQAINKKCKEMGWIK